MELVLMVHELARCFPPEEKYALGSQMRRAAYSVPSNIAEGAARETDKELIRTLYIARGSLAELETQLEIAARLHYADDLTEITALMERVSRTLNGYLRYVQTRRK